MGGRGGGRDGGRGNAGGGGRGGARGFGGRQVSTLTELPAYRLDWRMMAVCGGKESGGSGERAVRGYEGGRLGGGGRCYRHQPDLCWEIIGTRCILSFDPLCLLSPYCDEW